MDSPFPSGLPTPTAFYLIFYLFTLALHVVFMNYVLAGTGWLAVAHLRPRRATASPPVKVLKDWMPLMLSGAITAGVAPLLFVQVLYQRQFYTANLLLFNRWMAILPVLIVGFYALYLLKSGWVARRGGWVLAGVSVVPLVCVAFTGYSWTENHLLSVRDPAYWGEFYGTRAEVYTEPQLVPRLAVWAFGSVPMMAVILGWQLWFQKADGGKTLARVALSGLAAVSAAAAAYYFATDELTRQAFVSPFAMPYFVAACLGLAVQAFGWLWTHRRGRYSAGPLALTAAGAALTTVGMTVCREAIRIAALGGERFEGLFPFHEAAMSKSGLVVFLTFFVLNAGLIGLCVWLVRKNTLPEVVPAPAEPMPDDARFEQPG
jgi:hypothetical protein